MQRKYQILLLVSIGLVGILIVTFFAISRSFVNLKLPQKSSTPQTSTRVPQAQVTYTTYGFQPTTLKLFILENGSVIFVNRSNTAIDVASDTENALNLGMIKPSEQKTVILKNPGNFDYYNRSNPAQKGTITILK